MEARIAWLETENYRLRSDLERLKNAVWRLEQSTRIDPFVRTCQVLTVITAVAAGVVWFG